MEWECCLTVLLCKTKCSSQSLKYKKKILVKGIFCEMNAFNYVPEPRNIMYIQWNIIYFKTKQNSESSYLNFTWAGYSALLSPCPWQSDIIIGEITDILSKSYMNTNQFRFIRNQNFCLFLAVSKVVVERNSCLTISTTGIIWPYGIIHRSYSFVSAGFIAIQF